MAGAETQTCLWGASLQAGILKKKRQKVECVNVLSFFHLPWLTVAAVAVCYVSPSVQLSLDVHLLFYPVLHFSC